MEAVNFCGINFSCLEQEQLFREDDETRFVVTVNAEFIVKANHNPTFLNIINDNYATFDGQIPYFFARLLNSQQHFDKISGSDLIYDACANAQKNNKSIFLLGGETKANKLSVEKIRATYGLRVDGYSPPYENYPFSAKNSQEILNKITEFKPDFLFVAFGAIKQEYWIHDHLDFLKQHKVRLVVGCGGTFDFVSGQVKRAPRFMQKAGFEGVWRLLAEPRLFRLRFRRLLESTRFFGVLYNHHLALGGRHNGPIRKNRF